MIKKVWVGILTGFLLILLSAPIEIFADSNMVIDMFDGDDNSVDKQNEGKTTETKNAQKNDSEDTGTGELVFNLVKMVFALFLILVLIYILLKFLNKRNKLLNQVKALENLGGISVGPSKSIQIVRVGSKLFLVGVGEDVQLLEEIEDEQLKAEILNSYEQQSSMKPGNIITSFQQKLTKQERPSKESSGDFQQLFSSELEKLKLNRKKLMNKHAEKEDYHE
ncbi:flagellar biosynthetic protein FliO [Ornithinibacillus bavariensis]|uniref:Flagellar biosynthetic protein FliZ n=1 Tax=Ornithinibacillus bavariensis TaxID=545502 RepID=A0A919X8Q9_9BACI|nr:flagellar biosynthetic protein FliO [Ornithinibacillus bavariensis]GIO26163.1 flagellar biosynthetic protein FliZ [Ornithinibacillus bavariensis]